MADPVMQIKGLAEVQQRLERAAKLVPQLTGQILFKQLNLAVTYARDRYLTGGTTTDRLAVRSGLLRASFGAEVQQSASGVTARIGYIMPQVVRNGADPLVYARIHEGWPDGRSSTTIRPRNAQYLTIPLAAAKTPAGVPRGRARDFPDTFVRRSQRGKLIIFQQTGNGIVPLFLLAKEVVIPARPALRPTMERFLPQIQAELGKVLTQALGGTGGRVAP